MLMEIFSILAPIFICVIIGYCWVKSGRLFDIELTSSIVTYFGTPCLLFYTLSTIDLAPQAIFEITVAAVLANLAFIALSILALKLLSLPLRPYLQSLTFPNVGIIGLPLCFFAFGEEGLALGVTFFAVYAIFQMTIIAAFVSQSYSPMTALKMPVIPITIVATLFLLSSTPVPRWLYNTTKLIGDLTLPLMLLTLGVSLSQLKVSSLKIPSVLSLFRLLMGFVVGVLLVELMGLKGVIAGVVILECTMPAAVFCYLFAQQFDQRPEEVAGIVIISTFLCFISLPALLWYVL